MGEWTAWARKVGDGLVNFGTPLAGGASCRSGAGSTPQVTALASSGSEATERSGAVKYAGYLPPVRWIQAVPSPARAATSMSHGCTATSMASFASTPHSANA